MEDFQLLGMIDIIGFTITSVYIIYKYGFKDFFYGWKEVAKKISRNCKICVDRKMKM